MSGRVFFYGGAVLSKTTRVLFAAVACAFVVTQATAQDAAAPSVSVGGGLRAGASWGDGDDNYGLNNVRLYINGTVGPASIEVNTESSADGSELDATILDAVAKLSVSDSVNVWVGRFLAPSDRANLSGPYYGNVGNDHARASSFYMNGNQQAGRDDGLAVWGNIGGDMNLKYQVGIFDGADDDDQMLAGRLVLNLWDAFCTIGWVHAGIATEANPVMAQALAAGPSTFILGKVALVLLGVGMLWRLRDQRLARVALVPVALLYAGVSGAHLGVALGYLTA